MALKSIIDVDVKSDSFKRFSDLYDKYQAQLAKTPNVWKQVGKEQSAMATQFERMTAAMMAQNALERERKEDDSLRLKNLEKTNQLWSSIGKRSSGIFKDLLGIGAATIKWGGVLAGVATGAGLFGFDRLAGSVGNSRFQAKGIGASIGQEKAFGVNFGRFVDTGSLLQNVMQMETNPSAASPWYTLMHGRKMTGNAAQDSLAFLTAERTWAKGQSVQTLGTMASALGLPSSVEDLMRLRGTSDTEFAQQVKAYQRDQGALNVSDKSARGAQDFQAQMARNLGQMTAALWASLGKLAGPLSQLTASITHAGVALLGSPAVKHGIEALTEWLKGFSGTIDTKAFDAKIKTFASDIGVVADGIHTLVGALGGIGGILSGWAGAKVGGVIGSFFGPVGTVVGTVAGAVAGDAGYQVYKHRAAIENAYALSYGALGAAYAPMSTNKSSNGNSAASPSAVTITIQNATGGSALVSIAGLAGVMP